MGQKRSVYSIALAMILHANLFALIPNVNNVVSHEDLQCT